VSQIRSTGYLLMAEVLHSLVVHAPAYVSQPSNDPVAA
jgi:hypothetical protein